MLLFVAGCGMPGAMPEPEGPSTVGTHRQAIINGTVDNGDPAVLTLVDVFSDGGTFEECSGTLIGRATLMTAGHCINLQEDPGTFQYVFMGTTLPTVRVEDDTTFIAVANQVKHPNYDENNSNTDQDDVGLIQLATAITNVPPIGLFTQPPTVGADLRHVGFGATTSKNVEVDGSGTKRQETSTVTALGSQLEYDSSTNGTCYGDSGGPGFMVDPDTHQELVEGVVSQGSNDCVSQGFDTYVHTHVSWIQQTMAPWEAAAGSGSGAPGTSPGGGTGGSGSNGSGSGGASPGAPEGTSTPTASSPSVPQSASTTTATTTGCSAADPRGLDSWLAFAGLVTLLRRSKLGARRS